MAGCTFPVSRYCGCMFDLLDGREPPSDRRLFGSQLSDSQSVDGQLLGGQLSGSERARDARFVRTQICPDAAARPVGDGHVDIPPTDGSPASDGDPADIPPTAGSPTPDSDPAGAPSTVDLPAPDRDAVDDLLGRLGLVDGVFDEVLAGLACCDASATLGLAGRLARLTSRLEGLTVHTQVHLARQRPANPAAGDGERGDLYSPFAADELAAELGQSPRTMSSRLATAWEIATRLPSALADLTAGMLDHTRLAALHQLTLCLTDRNRATVEAAMLTGSRLASPPQWRRKIHRLVARLDPDAAAKRRRRAHTERRIGIQSLDDGMALLTAVLPAEDAQAIYDRINQIAHTDSRLDSDTRSIDTRPIDARRADVLTALLLGNRREHVSVELQVIAPVGTLAGLDDNPTELVGYGPIPAKVGRALAADAHWRRVLTDPETGTVLDLGHRCKSGCVHALLSGLAAARPWLLPVSWAVSWEVALV
nr:MULTISPECIES: DUF222 domain-containing protein [unclassified Frankia]